MKPSQKDQSSFLSFIKSIRQQEHVSVTFLNKQEQVLSSGQGWRGRR